MPGLTALAAVATPLISPPPPIGTTSVSSAGCSASISSASVPWPAMMAWSSNGCTKLRPCSRARACACALAASSVSPCRITSAPKPCVRATFTPGVKRGITITARMPSRSA